QRKEIMKAFTLFLVASTVLLALAGCTTSQNSNTLPVSLRVKPTNGQPKVYASRQQIEAVLRKKLPSEGWVSSQDVYIECVRSTTPPGADGTMHGEAGIVPLRIMNGSSDILVFGNIQGCQPGYWGVRLMGKDGPLSDWAIVELKK
ncbi:MAG: hypothetical protein JSV82_04725, partial [Planctomycetota bacterium]